MKHLFQNRRRPKIRQAVGRLAGKLWIGLDLALLLGCYLAIFGVSGFLFQMSKGIPLMTPGPEDISWSAPDGGQWMDWLGRDGRSTEMVFRIIRAGAVSLWSALLATGAGAVLGLGIAGAMALTIRERGYGILVRVTDVFSCVPAMVLVLIFFAGAGAGVRNTVIIFSGLIAFFTIGRVGRWLFDLEIEGDVLAARGLGYSRFRLLRENLMSRLVPGMAAWVAGLLPAVLLAEAALSFAGFGLGENSPSLGRLIAEGRAVMFEAPWLVLYPGLALWILAVVLAMLGWAVRRTARARIAEPVV